MWTATTVIPIYGVRGCGIIYAKFLLGQFFGLHRYPHEKYIFSSYYIRVYFSIRMRSLVHIIVYEMAIFLVKFATFSENRIYLFHRRRSLRLFNKEFFSFESHQIFLRNIFSTITINKIFIATASCARIAVTPHP